MIKKKAMKFIYFLEMSLRQEPDQPIEPDHRIEQGHRNGLEHPTEPEHRIEQGPRNGAGSTPQTVTRQSRQFRIRQEK